MKKILYVFLAVVLSVSAFAGCGLKIYKEGVDYKGFPDKDIPVYDDAVVFLYKEKSDEWKIEYGTKDDVDDVSDFYKDEFGDEDYTITAEQEGKGEYFVEGTIDDYTFEIEVQEASGDAADYFSTIVAIKAEESKSEDKSDLSGTSEIVTDEGKIAVEREPEPQVLQTASAANALALRQYIYARLKTEEFLSADNESMTVEEFQKLMDDLVLAWETADTLMSGAEEIIDQALMVLESPAFSQAAAFIPPTTQLMSFDVKNTDLAQPTTYSMSFDAASFDFEATSLSADGGREIDPETWAENLTKQYDALRGAQRHKQLAEQLGVDTKTACEQMALAQKIIHNIADLEELRAEDSAYTKSINIVQGYKTASKVGVFVTATIATGGGSLAALGSSSMTLGQAGAVIVGGVDCVVDVAATGSTIVLGEDHQVTTSINNIQNKLAPISFVVGLATFNPGETGEQLAYIGESLTEWYFNGKILGVSVSGTDDGGTKVTAQPIDVSGLDEAGVKSKLETAGFSTPEEGKSTLSSIIEEYRSGIEEAASKMATLAAEMAAIMEEFNILVPQPEETVPIEKKIIITIRNTSGQACYLDAVPVGYFDDVDGVFIGSLVVESGGNCRNQVNVEEAILKGTLIETSPTTYEIIYTFVYGALPTEYPDDKTIKTANLSFYDLTIYGTYSTDIYNSDLDQVIEWDGSSFTQVK